MAIWGALGLMALAMIAGAVVLALTLIQDTTEDTPIAVVGETAGAAVGPVQAVGSVASSPLDAVRAEASGQTPADTATPTPEPVPTETPTPEPTATPEPTPTPTPEPPNPPESVSASFTECADTQSVSCGVSLAWSAPGFGDAPENYEAKISLADGSGSEINSGSLDSTTTSHSFTVTAYGAYKAEVRASNQAGVSPWVSANVDVLVVPAVIDLITPTRSDGAIALSWTVPSDGGSPLLRYEIECSDDNGATYLPCFTDITPSGLEGETFTTTLSGVNNYQTYYLMIRAVNAIGNAGWNGLEVLPPGLPSNVASVSIVRDGFSISATWDASESTTHYLVELYKWGPGPELAQTLSSVTETSAEFTIGDFNKSHTVSVTSKNAFGSGERADSALVRMPDPPAAPSSVSGTRSPNGASIAATWASVDGASSYDVRYSADNGTSWTTASTGATDTKTTISGLSASESYILSARASKTYTGDGGASATLTSEWSSSSDTIHAPPGAPAITSVTGSGDQKATITWSRPSFTGTGSENLKFNIYCRASADQSFWILALKELNPAPQLTTLQIKVSEDQCRQTGSQVAVSAINVIEGAKGVYQR